MRKPSIFVQYGVYGIHNISTANFECRKRINTRQKEMIPFTDMLTRVTNSSWNTKERHMEASAKTDFMENTTEFYRIIFLH